MSEYLTTNIPSDQVHPPVALGDSPVGIGTIQDENCVRVQMTCEGDVRVTYDGSNPSNVSGSEAGHLFLTGFVFDETKLSAEGMLFVSAVPGGSAVLRITEWTENPVPADPVWKSINWLKFLQRLARRRQVDILSGAFSYEWVGMATEFVATRLREVWTSAEWPAFMQVEERYYPDPEDKHVPWREDGQREIPEDGVDARRCIYATQPREVDPQTGLECHQSVRGIEVTDSLAPAASCFVRYRAPGPRFTADNHVEGQSYDYGEVVFVQSTGECYLSRMDGNTDAPVDEDGNEVGTWSRQLFPDLLAEAVIYYVIADLLEEDGQHEKAGRQIAYADGFLMDLQERVFGNAGPSAQFVVNR